VQFGHRIGDDGGGEDGHPEASGGELGDHRQSAGLQADPALPTLVSGDLALTSTPPKDGAGARAQVVRRQPDGSWLRVLDQPEFVTPGG
jgi:hypothetical protein